MNESSPAERSPAERPQESPSSVEEAFVVAAKIQPALNKLVVIFQRTTEGSSLTTSQVSIMNQLKERGPSRVSQIAQAELIRMPTASNALYQLERRGLVKRMRDKNDRRGVLVALTSEGDQELAEVSNQRAYALAEILRWLSPDGLETAEEVAGLINQLAEIYRPHRD